MFWLKIFFNTIFYQPILNALVFLTSILPGHDLGLAVILLTVIIRALMFPLTHKMLKTQNAMKIIEPEVKKIYADKKNKEDQAKALMELYKKHGINPLSGFFILLIQLPILFAMYQVFLYGLPFPAGDVYSFLKIPENINTVFLGFISLTEASVGLAALAALSQFWQARLALPPKDFNLKIQKNDPPDRQTGMGQAMQWQMLYVFPFIIFILGFKLPAAVSLYWTAMNVFAIVHEARVREKAHEALSHAGG